MYKIEGREYCVICRKVEYGEEENEKETDEWKSRKEAQSYKATVIEMNTNTHCVCTLFMNCIRYAGKRAITVFIKKNLVRFFMCALHFIKCINSTGSCFSSRRIAIMKWNGILLFPFNSFSWRFFLVVLAMKLLWLLLWFE